MIPFFDNSNVGVAILSDMQVDITVEEAKETIISFEEPEFAFFLYLSH